ncbi:MAG: COG4223 family protein [Paracoccaceae bacterium]
MDKEQKDIVSPNLKGRDNSSKGVIMMKRSPLIITSAILLFLTILLFVFTSAWFYKTISKQREKINQLTKKFEEMPKPISQGRLSLIINKSNQNLESKVKEDLGLLEKKIIEVNQELKALPQPTSEGKIGLIVKKEIKSLRQELKTQFDKTFSSLDEKDKIREERNGLSGKLQAEVGEIKKSLTELKDIIGSHSLSNSITQEVKELKDFINVEQKTTLSIPSKDKVEIMDLHKKDFALIAKQFSDFSHKAIKEDLRVNVGDGLVNGLVNKFQRIFVKRSLTPQPGNSVDAILSRAESALNFREYKKVIDELNKLPEGASKVMEDWRKDFNIFLEEKDRD